MAATVKIVTEVKSIEKIEARGFSDREYLLVKCDEYNAKLSFEVPFHKAASYPIGRRIVVTIKAE